MLKGIFIYFLIYINKDPK